MDPWLEQLLAEFTDREPEMETFRQVLRDGGGRLLWIWGEGDVGKSTLLARMAYEAQLLGHRTANIDWKEVNYSYVEVMCLIRNALDVEDQSLFAPFTARLNSPEKLGYELYIRLDPEVRVLEGARIEDSETGNITGVVNNVTLTDPRNERERVRDERMLALSEAFVACLGESAKCRPVVLFFDTLQVAPEDTTPWLRGHILAAVRDGRLPGVTAVISGRGEPQLDRNWLRISEVLRLRPFGHEENIAYLDRRGVQKEHQQPLAFAFEDMLPGAIALRVDAWLERSRSRVAE